MRPRTLAVLLILVVALGGFIWFYERDLPSTEERSELSKKLVRLDVEGVRSVTLFSGERRVRLERADARADPDAGDVAETANAETGEWMLTEPYKRRADDVEVETFLERLRDLDKLRSLEDVTRDQLGLDHPRAEVALETSAGEMVLRFGGEIPATSNTVVEIGDGPPFFVVSGDLVEEIAREPNDWRSRDAVPFERTRIEKLEILDPESQVVLERSGEGFRMTAPIEDAADRAAVDELLQALIGLEAKEFLDDTAAAFPAVAAVVRLTVDGAEAPVVVEVARGAAVEDVRSRLRVGNEDFFADTELASLLERTPAEWRSTEWTDLEPFEIEAFRVQRRGAEEQSFDLGEGDWKRDDEEIDYSAVSAFLRSVAEARGVPTGSDPAIVETPEVEIGLESRRGRAETLRLWATGDGYAAERLDRPARLALDAGSAHEFWKALGDLEAAIVSDAATEPE